jgi:hypothetical protein
MKSKMGGVEFARAPLLGQYLSIRDTEIFGYPQEERETLPPLSPGGGTRKLSGERGIARKDQKGVGATWPMSPIKGMRNPWSTARLRWSTHMGDGKYILLLLYAAEPTIIPSMRYSWTLIGLLGGLCLIGANTTQMIPAATESVRVGWRLYLLAFPIALAGLVWMGWSWTAMACVIYGTVGLALDFATVTSILGGKGETDTLFFFSVMSGIVNFLLIVFGARAFLYSFQETSLPLSRPPNPPSPSSSARS